MPNFYSEGGYMKDGAMAVIIHNEGWVRVNYHMMQAKMNSLARSSASLYGNKEELYDRLRRHAYHAQPKKGGCSQQGQADKFLTSKTVIPWLGS